MLTHACMHCVAVCPLIKGVCGNERHLLDGEALLSWNLLQHKTAPLGFHKRSLFHFLLNNFAHTRLLCGFDNDKIATGSRRWRGKRVGHGGNFNEIAACSQSQKHRWEFPPRCWHIRSVHPRHHPWAHRISNASIYSRACGWCDSSESLHFLCIWGQMHEGLVTDVIQWLFVHQVIWNVSERKDKEEAKVKEMHSLEVEKRNCFILEFQFWNNKKNNL